MAQNINIRRDVDDLFYRYKMPRLIAKIEGRGNGIKTVVVNMDAIAKALSRPPLFPAKYFGYELGAQVTTDEKLARYVLTGAHEQEKLASILDGFIDKFVLCGSCKNPETELILVGSSKVPNIEKNCAACGAKTEVDMKHKLVSVVIKSLESSKVSKKELKKANKKITNSGSLTNCTQQGVNGNGESDNTLQSPRDSTTTTPPNEWTGENAGSQENLVMDSEDTDELTRRIEEDARLLSISDSKDVDDFLEDTSEDAVARRQQELMPTGALAKLMACDDDDDNEGGAGDPLNVLGDYVSSQIKSATCENDKELFSLISKKSIELGVRQDKALVVLVQVLFTQNVLKEKQVKRYAPLFRSLMTEESASEKCQKAILGAIERLVGELFPELLGRVALILKDLYEEELVEEDAFLAWAEKPSKKYVDKAKSKEIRVKAEPFITWLKEAESEEDDDEDDDE